MNAQIQTATKLSNLQMELLKLYARNVSDEQLKEIRKMLADYFAARVDSEMDKLWQEKGWTKGTIEGWKNEDLRTKSVGTNEAETGWWDELSPEEQKELEMAIQESYDEQNWISHEEATTMINQWLK